MEVHVPTMFEIHQIAYLTMKGWTLSWGGEDWSKKGFQRTVQTRRSCGCHYEDHVTEEFDLDSAYEAQQEADGHG